MLVITVPISEGFDEQTQEFVVRDAFTLELEHSLASLSKWESREEKPFLARGEKTTEQVLNYIKDMTLTPDVPEKIYSLLTRDNVEAVNAYINAKMTATTFSNRDAQRPSREIITAEIIYHWMVHFHIPFECQYWHLNRLMTLVQVCNEKNTPPKKMGRRSAAAQQRALNEQRKQQYNTRG